ncbi:MAG: hypothetical protein QOF01_3865 [Thermomicrobiales bacterium]|nr:hypothetical protein [Thermomicrobiales bacterium]
MKSPYEKPTIVPIGTVTGMTLNSGGSCRDGGTINKALPPGQSTCNQTGDPGNSGN